MLGEERESERALKTSRGTLSLVNVVVFCSPLLLLEPNSKTVLLASGGKDIIKKSMARKGRYLLNIAAALRPTAAGKMVRSFFCCVLMASKGRSNLSCLGILALSHSFFEPSGCRPSVELRHVWTISGLKKKE